MGPAAMAGAKPFQVQFLQYTVRRAASSPLALPFLPLALLGPRPRAEKLSEGHRPRALVALGVCAHHQRPGLREEMCRSAPRHANQRQPLRRYRVNDNSLLLAGALEPFGRGPLQLLRVPAMVKAVDALALTRAWRSACEPSAVGESQRRALVGLGGPCPGGHRE